MYSDLTAWQHHSSGKVRELYTPKGKHPLGDVVLVVATDRISSFDHILDTKIPGKGVILTQMSILWFQLLEERLGIKTHFVTAEGIPVELAGRAIICKRLDMIPVECVARGFLTGSAFEEYAKTGKYQEFEFELGLKDGAPLNPPIFTPAMKADVGDHDENVPYSLVADRIGKDVASDLRDKTLAIYDLARGILKEADITLVDTKLEFGKDLETGEIILGDEVLTPDSSRFWNDLHESFDKQFVRNWLLRDSGWDVNSGTKPPALPPEIVEKTTKLYKQALEKLKGTL